MPMTQNFALDPGESYEGSIKVINPATAKKDFEFKVTAEPYNVVGDNYQIDLLNRSKRNSIVDWITFEESEGKLAPNETKEIKFTINVPEDAESGGQYASITVESSGQESRNEGLAISDVVEMASIIYGEVSGDVHHDGAIINNSVPIFSMTVPIEVSADISNTGNVHDSAKVTIKVRNAITGEVLLPTDTVDGEFDELVMPETERHITRQIDNLPMLGIIQVEQKIDYLGDSSVVTNNVFICPLWFMLLVIATVLAVIGGIVWGIIKHRRKKADIL